MTDNATTEPGTTDGPRELREALDRKDEQLKEKDAQINQLNSKLMQTAFRDAGLNPLEGMGKAVAKLYEGEPDAAAIADYASTEFGWTPDEPGQAPAQAVNAAQGRVDQAVADSQPLGQTPDEASQIVQLERDGKWLEAMDRKLALARTQQSPS